MDLRPLGSTGLFISPLGLGTVKIGRTRGLKHPETFELPSDNEVVRLLETARECAVNLIDTAPAYGTSEQRLGNLLPGSRDEWIISTKCGETFDGAGSNFDFSPEATRASVERSLSRLKTDHLDIVLVHSDGQDERIIREMGTLQALADLKSSGAAQAIGMSTKTCAGALLAIEQCDVVMLTLNLRDRDDLPAVRAAHDAGIGVLIKKALASGHLDALSSLAPEQNPVEASIRYATSHPGVSSVIVGTRSPSHLKEMATMVCS